MDAVHVGGLGGTFGGNPVACAAALAVIDQIEREGLLARAEAIGTTMRERRESFRERFDLVGDVRSLGAMVAMELVEDRETKRPARDATSRLLAECHREGLILLKAGTYDNVVRLLPPLTIAEPLLEEGLGIVEKALATASGA
jgi:4-aminobutyrate aminotransferase/(S)-3-amino-2-methylpropionate transaminase